MSNGYPKNRNKKTDNASDVAVSYKHDTEADIGELFWSREVDKLSFKKNIASFQRYGDSNGAGNSYKNLGSSSVVSNIDWSAATVQELDIDNDPTLTFSEAVAGSHVDLLLTSSTTPRTVTWPSNVLWNQNIAPTVTPAIPGGARDATFQIGTGFQSGPASFVKTLSDGKLLVHATYSYTYNNENISKVARLNANGTLDTTWVYTQYSSGEFLRAVVELPDGKILLGGFMQSYGMPASYGNTGIQLLDSDGTRIDSFAPNVGGMGQVYDMAVQSSGKIIVVGNFSDVNGIPGTHSIFRLNEDLTVDTSFIVNFDIPQYTNITTVDVLSDDSIIIGGPFESTTINGVGSYTALAKLTPEGIAIGSSFGNVVSGMYGLRFKLRVTSTDKIYLGGSLSLTDGMTTYQSVVRLNSDGTRDTSFSVTDIWPINQFELLPNDKIAVIGASSWGPISPVAQLIVVEMDGQINPDIIIGYSAFNSNVYAVAAQNDKLVVVGYFTTYNNVSSNYIVRLNTISQVKAYTKLNFQYNGVEYIGSF